MQWFFSLKWFILCYTFTSTNSPYDFHCIVTALHAKIAVACSRRTILSDKQLTTLSDNIGHYPQYEAAAETAAAYVRFLTHARSVTAAGAEYDDENESESDITNENEAVNNINDNNKATVVMRQGASDSEYTNDVLD